MYLLLRKNSTPKNWQISFIATAKAKTAARIS
jgi:hypothetical protein